MLDLLSYCKVAYFDPSAGDALRKSLAGRFKESKIGRVSKIPRINDLNVPLAVRSLINEERSLQNLRPWLPVIGEAFATCGAKRLRSRLFLRFC